MDRDDLGNAVLANAILEFVTSSWTAVNTASTSAGIRRLAELTGLSLADPTAVGRLDVAPESHSIVAPDRT